MNCRTTNVVLLSSKCISNSKIYYIDGKLDTEWKPPGNQIFSVDIVFRIGKSQTNLSGTVCLIDEVAVYSRALSEDEINVDMNKGIFFDVSPGGKLATTWGDLKR